MALSTQLRRWGSFCYPAANLLDSVAPRSGASLLATSTLTLEKEFLYRGAYVVVSAITLTQRQNLSDVLLYVLHHDRHFHIM
jgi:hypothetical protein